MSKSFVITNAQILDGLGNPVRKGSVLVRDGRVKSVNYHIHKTYDAAEADIPQVDLAGAYLSPGFIDVHTHSDLHILHSPQALNSISQGVTTETIGNCGFSPFPYSYVGKRMRTREMSGVETVVTWKDLDGYASAVMEKGTAINLVPLLGHGRLRTAACGYKSGKPTVEAMSAMRAHVECAVSQGAWGMSSGLEYAPGSFAGTEELAELAGEFRQVDGLYTTHMRNEGEFLLDAIREAIAVAERADVKLQISHLKISGRPFWGRMEQALDLIESAAERGVRVYFDRYPYLAVSTSLSIFLPTELWEGGKDAFLKRVLDERPRWEEHIRNRVEQRSGFSGVIITDSGSADRAYQGNNLDGIGRHLGMPPEKAAIEILLESQGDASIACFSMNEEETAKVLAHPRCFIGSDGSVHAPHGPLSELCPHPRSYGSFARFLGEYVRDRRLIELPEAIRKMTSAPARHFGIPKRGTVEAGAVADLVAFRLDEVRELSDYGDPHRLAAGFSYVWVGGVPVVRGGRPTGALPGEVLLRR